VSRAVAVLRLLAKNEQPLGLTAIASRLELIPSSCLRLLRVLVAEELVRCDPATKRYSLDAGILTLARSALRPTSFARMVQPALDELSRSYGLTAAAVQVLSLEHIVIVAVAEARLPLRVHVEIGSRFPALMSATGQCLAAFSTYPWGSIESAFRAVRWQHPPTLATWRAEVAATHRNRYSIDEGRYMAGFTAIAAPILDGAQCMTHGIVVLGVGEQFQRVGVQPIAGAVRSIADSFSVGAGKQSVGDASTPERNGRPAVARRAPAGKAGRARSPQRPVPG
jgi:DNA-binding IclR family transcriptional regulator